MTTLFNYDFEEKKITKPIRLIELFGGIGSQASALENLGANFEHYRLCEFDECAVKSYNAAHNTNFKTSDITKIHASDLGIEETNKYEYIMTYSFPCQDLSVAGKMNGLEKGSGTRSSLLWEVQRLLQESQELPQVLVMENVKGVHSPQNIESFRAWQKFLEELGYQNYYEDLVASDYGIPQKRERTIMVSLLGDYYYDFPQPKKLDKTISDMLEQNVDESYYLSNKKYWSISHWRAYQKPFERVLGKNSICPTLTARGAGEEHSGMILVSEKLEDTTSLQEEIIYSKGIVDLASKYRVRYITPRESWRLMGFSDEQFDRASKVNDKTQLYRQAGNSIVVNVLMAIFKQML